MKNLNLFFSRLLLLFIFAFILASCEDKIEEAIIVDIPLDAFVINQGGYGLNTASLLFLNFQTDEVEHDIYINANGSELGDMANDILINGDKIYILVSNSGILEIINKETYKSEAAINLKNVNGEFAYPQNMEIYEDKIYITDASASNIIVFDIASETVSGTIPTGPNPEDIEIYDGMIYTANTAYGNTSNTISGNRTVSVIDIASEKEIKQITVGTNTKYIDIDEDNNVLYVGYTDITWEGKTGGIKSYDLGTYEEINSFDVGIITDLQVNEDGIYFITSSGLNKANLSLGNSELIIENTAEGESWSSFNISSSGDIWILNAKDYTINGNALYFENGKLTSPSSYEVGIAPIEIIFK